MQVLRCVGKYYINNEENIPEAQTTCQTAHWLFFGLIVASHLVSEVQSVRFANFLADKTATGPLNV